MSRVLMVSHGSDGDLLPFIRLGQELAGRGHEVTLLGPEPYAPAAGERIRFVAATSTEAYRRELTDTPQLLRGPGPTTVPAFFRRHRLVDMVRREVATLLAGAASPEGTVLVGRHASAMSVLLTAEVTGAAAAWLAQYPIQYLTGRIALANIAPVLHDEIATLRSELGLAPEPDWTPWFTGQAGPGVHHLGLWPDWFDRAAAPAPAAVTLTGFIPADSVHPQGAAWPGPLPAPVRALFAGEPAPVLVTGGTGRMLHERYYRAAVAAARELGRPVLVVTRHRDLVPDVHAADVCWQPWLPFAAVFPHVAAVIHHGGLGTILRALACGTPQLLLAHGFDRSDNGERLARLGLGSCLPVHQWAAAAGALAGVLAAGSPPAVPGLDRDRLDSTALVADRIEKLAQDGGPGLAGPAQRAPDRGAPGRGAPGRRELPETTADRIRALSPQRRVALARLRERRR